MRKFLLASVAALGTGGLIGTAVAQTPVVGAPTQGQTGLSPAASPPAGANNNNNYQAAALPGPVANPTPGTIVIHVNGRVKSQLQVNGEAGYALHAASRHGSARRCRPAGGHRHRPPLRPPSSAKTAPAPPRSRRMRSTTTCASISVPTQWRRTACATARRSKSGRTSPAQSAATPPPARAPTMRFRRCTCGAPSPTLPVSSGASSASARRTAIIGIFDNGVTTNQFLVNNLNGGDKRTCRTAAPPFFFLSQAGDEYGNAKIVYLSPQFAGFDFGFQWAPNTSNGYGIGTTAAVNSIISAGTGTGLQRLA